MRITSLVLSTVAVLGTLAVTDVIAADTNKNMQDCMSHEGMAMDMKDMTAAQKDFMAAMQKMDKAMMSGMMVSDPDESWRQQMIAHHQGAIDMSQVVLKHGKNEAMRTRARETIAMNEKDLKKLQKE